ncbi:peptidase M6 [Spiractinospora alimapuensis]|uniref:peptidase M6 n=1 Tax=Spiractinospora alimapuensis TaxID=2820884 RepID=UPI001F41485C|nr:peptidase M6 [Spiractinospora alimapuensis]QVQ52350.1 peptidase M6 [Spiractinospora alimapuensis]
MPIPRRGRAVALVATGALVLAGLATSPAAAEPDTALPTDDLYPWQEPNWPQTQPWQDTDAPERHQQALAAERSDILDESGAPEPIDPQDWVNPDHMTWDDWTDVPGTNWADTEQVGSEVQFKGAVVLVDYENQPFALTMEAGSTPFGNPTEEANSIPRDELADWWHDFLNVPGDINRGRTLHEFWMEGSGGRMGIELEAFGPYEMSGQSFEYGIEDRWQNDEDCPPGYECDQSLPPEAESLWLENEGDEISEEFDFIFYVSSGNDESGVWQEFGPMMWENPEDVSDEFGPPDPDMESNAAGTRYVEWTSWAAAAGYWSHAGPGYSVQSESSSHGTFSHEFSHVLGIADNYNNPMADPVRRTYSGIWGNLSRGIFNGPGGPHTRFTIPATSGGAVGAHHMLRDRLELEMVDVENDVLHLSRDELAESGAAVAQVTARSAVTAGDQELAGVNIVLDGGDQAPNCDWTEDLYCDGGDYDNYTIEAVDRMGYDSFTPDNGVLLSKTKDQDRAPFVWVVDANPGDIGMVDFVWPDGTPEYITEGDYRQLSNSAFHAGTDSGSEYEYVDEDNRLHFYIVDLERDDDGILTYTVATRSLDGSGDQERGVELPSNATGVALDDDWVRCEVELTNSGEAGDEPHTSSDVYRLSARAPSPHWEVWLPNELAVAEAGESTTVEVYANRTNPNVGGGGNIHLTAESESDSSVSDRTVCTPSG